MLNGLKFLNKKKNGHLGIGSESVPQICILWKSPWSLL